VYNIDDIEDGFIAALQPLLTAGVRTLETYGGQLNVEEIKNLTINFPAIYIIWMGFNLTQINRVDAELHRVSVIIGHSNLRGEAAARRGAPEAAGVYAIMRQARGFLHKKRVVDWPGWTPAKLVRGVPLAYTGEGGIAIYEQAYELKARV
jgi:phage gp37-like protein